MDTVTVREVAESIRSADEWRRRAEAEVILGICRLAEGYSVDRDELVEAPFEIRPDGCVLPLDKPGLGLAVNEDFLKRHPAIVGPSYV